MSKLPTSDNLANGGTSEPRVASFELNNTSDVTQNIIFLDSSSIVRSVQELEQVMSGTSFGADSKVTLDAGGSKAINEIEAFVSDFPILLSSVEILSASGSQRDVPLKILTPVLFKEPIIELLKGEYSDGGKKYQMPASLFIGEGSALSFDLLPNTKATLKLNLAHFMSSRLIS